MKKSIIPILLFSNIGIYVCTNLVYALISFGILHVSYTQSIWQYTMIFLTYLCVVILVLFENNNLEKYHIDRFSLVILMAVGFFRFNFKAPGEIYFRIALFLLSSALLLLFIKYYQKIPATKPRWIFIGVLSCLLVIPLAFIDSLKPMFDPDSAVKTGNFLTLAIGQVLRNLLLVSPFEEIIYRGVLWGQLRKWGWTDKRIFWFQAILFWFVHFWELFIQPFTFITIVPIAILVESLLARYSKQVFPSILFHTACNGLIGLITLFYIVR